MSARPHPALLGLLGLLAAGPATAAPGGLTVPGPEPEAIIGGVPTEPGELDAVVAFRNSSNNLCSGTLVTTRLVLTAAHCLVDQREDSPVTVFFGPDTDGERMESLEFGYHPAFCDYCQEEAYDYAYIVLPEPYEPADGVIAPVTDQDEWDETMRQGRVALLSGYGLDEPEGGFSDETKREVTTIISRFTEYGFEFYAGGNQRDTCFGDSGGPAIVTLGDGTRRLAGITSRGSDPCGNGGFYGVPFVILPWVNDQTGIDLLPPNCSSLDCLDLLPPDEGRCAVGRADEPGPAWALALLVLGLHRRRRASRARPTP